MPIRFRSSRPLSGPGWRLSFSSRSMANFTSAGRLMTLAACAGPLSDSRRASIRPGLALPHRVVAALVLEMDRDVAVAGPVAAEVLVALPRPAQAVRENHDRQRPLAGLGEIDLHRHVALPGVVLPVVEHGLDGQRAGRGVLVCFRGVAVVRPDACRAPADGQERQRKRAAWKNGPGLHAILRLRRLSYNCRDADPRDAPIAPHRGFVP